MENINKNILFITNLHLWSLEKGKGGRAFINTVEGYKKAGWNIWFITSGGGVPEGLIDKDKLFEKSFPILDKLWTSKVRVISIFVRFLKMFFLNRFYYTYGKKILKEQDKRRFVIYAYEVDGVISAKKLSNKFNFPLVTRFQGTKHYATPDNINNRIRKVPSLQAYKTPAKLTIMTNDGTQGLNTLKRLGNKSCEILFWRNGVTKIPEDKIDKQKDFRKQYKFGDEFTFITVSRLVNWKKVERAIHAFSIVSEKYPKTKLLILGDGDAKSDLIKLTENLGLQNSVKFTGAIQQKEVSNYMIAADAFLSFYDLSNVGNPLMEAMMCSKPIITLDVGDTRELIMNNKNGILLSIDELNKIPEMMCKLIDDKSFANKIAQGALDTAHKEFWSWEERISSEISKVKSLLK